MDTLNSRQTWILHVEENLINKRFVFILWTCKIKKQIKREVVFSFSADSPLLWIRIDPDMSVLRKVEFEQADFMWQYQLRYERDVVAQQESILALEKFPTPASRLALTDILEQEQCFYRVRMSACFCLAKVRLHIGERKQDWILNIKNNRTLPWPSWISGWSVHKNLGG